MSSAEDYQKLHETEQKYFVDMVKSCKDSGATLILCQWGFDDEANHLLYQAGTFGSVLFSELLATALHCTAPHLSLPSVCLFANVFVFFLLCAVAM